MFGHRQIKHYSAYKKNQHVHLGFKGDVHFNFTCQKSGYILPPFLVTKKVGSINRLPIFPLFTAFSKISMAGRDFSLGSWTTNMSAITLPFLQPQKHWTGEFIKVFYVNWSLFTVHPFTMWMQTIQVCGELEGNQVLTPRTKFLDFQNIHAWSKLGQQLHLPVIRIFCSENYANTMMIWNNTLNI